MSYYKFPDLFKPSSQPGTGFFRPKKKMLIPPPRFPFSENQYATYEMICTCMVCSNGEWFFFTPSNKELYTLWHYCDPGTNPMDWSTLLRSRIPTFLTPYLFLSMNDPFYIVTKNETAEEDSGILAIRIMVLGYREYIYSEIGKVEDIHIYLLPELLIFYSQKNTDDTIFFTLQSTCTDTYNWDDRIVPECIRTLYTKSFGYPQDISSGYGEYDLFVQNVDEWKWIWAKLLTDEEDNPVTSYMQWMLCKINTKKIYEQFCGIKSTCNRVNSINFVTADNPGWFVRELSLDVGGFFGGDRNYTKACARVGHIGASSTLMWEDGYDSGFFRHYNLVLVYPITSTPYPSLLQHPGFFLTVQQTVDIMNTVYNRSIGKNLTPSVNEEVCETREAFNELFPACCETDDDLYTQEDYGTTAIEVIDDTGTVVATHPETITGVLLPHNQETDDIFINGFADIFRYSIYFRHSQVIWYGFSAEIQGENSIRLIFSGKKDDSGASASGEAVITFAGPVLSAKAYLGLTWGRVTLNSDVEYPELWTDLPVSHTVTQWDGVGRDDISINIDATIGANIDIRGNTISQAQHEYFWSGWFGASGSGGE